MAIVRPKEAYHQRTAQEMQKHLLTPDWNIRQKIALSCRMLADEGHESALAGQITARAEKPGTYWMLSFGLGFDEAQASNIVLCDDDLNLLEGDGMVNPSNRFHLWIYRHRPQVNAIIHTHPPYCSALSLTGEPLVAAHMDTSMFYDDCAFLPEWPGPPIGDEGRRDHSQRARQQPLHPACAPRPAMRVQHDGRSGGAFDFHRARGAHAVARASGRPDQTARSRLAKEAHDYRLKPKAVGATFHYFARRVLRKSSEVLE